MGLGSSRITVARAERACFSSININPRLSLCVPTEHPWIWSLLLFVLVWFEFCCRCSSSSTLQASAGHLHPASDAMFRPRTCPWSPLVWFSAQLIQLLDMKTSEGRDVGRCSSCSSLARLRGLQHQLEGTKLVIEVYLDPVPVLLVLDVSAAFDAEDHHSIFKSCWASLELPPTGSPPISKISNLWTPAPQTPGKSSVGYLRDHCWVPFFLICTCLLSVMSSGDTALAFAAMLTTRSSTALETLRTLKS